ncbi:hypothetical protein BXO88_11615 [Oribacterium sp. C9]|uniref:hypothetical protein n=1 Tax=Oribacterium sp. C9 TaxID=1943579 RepID=UPI00098F0821|nr:hypothetical protein [Oribacterium sp. C9]OON85577.1 hypothetical protein BXO88_11615 [Oribacterium sp. C9]
MKLKKISAALMTAVLVTSTPAGAYLGQISSFAKEKEEEEEKNYSISAAAWDEEIDSNGKTHVFAVWSESDDKANANISISVDEKKQSSVGSITTTTTAGRKELTSYIKKINKTGSYTFKITSGKKNKGEDEKSSSESDALEIDSEYLKNLASSNSTSSSSGSSSGSSSSKGPGASSASSSNTANASGSTPAAAMNGSAAGQASKTSEQAQAPATGWQDWGYGWVYLEDGQLVKDKWVVSNGKFYHLNSTGFMDVNTYVTDSVYGTNYVGADGAVVN